MSNPVWSGTISFGLVAIPVRLYHGVNKKNISFNQIDDRTMSRIRLKKVSAGSGEDVPAEHIVKGFEISKGHYIVVDPDELDPFIPSATKSIDLERFVDLAEIDPVYFDSPYIVAPDKAPKPYVLLARAMEAAGKVGIARLVMRNKQYVAALRAQNGKLLLSTMVYADEVVNADEIEGLHGLGAIDVSEKEVRMAEALVDTLSAPFEPATYRDEYRDNVLDLIERKAAGETFEAAPTTPSAPVVDLMAALEASVAAAKHARTRHPTAKPARRAASKKPKSVRKSA
jgi:DNA end-binding protein Ku